MQMLEVLHQAATCEHNYLLTDESMWNIITEYFVHRNTVVHSLTLSHAAEEYLISIVKVVFVRFRVVIESEGTTGRGTNNPSNNNNNNNMQYQASYSGGSSDTTHSRGFGLPVAMKMIAFLCAQLHVASPLKSQQPSINAASDKVIHEKDRSKIICLRLIHTALETGGGRAVGKCPPVQVCVCMCTCFFVTIF
jgi:hypothetical protein